MLFEILSESLHGRKDVSLSIWVGVTSHFTSASTANGKFLFPVHARHAIWKVFLCQWQCKRFSSLTYRPQMRRHVPICHPQIHAGSQDGLPSGKSILMRRERNRQEYSFARQIAHH